MIVLRIPWRSYVQLELSHIFYKPFPFILKMGEKLTSASLENVFLNGNRLSPELNVCY